MKIETFKMERMQSTWENVVDYNISESGVHPLSFQELVTQEELEEILKVNIGYIQANGTPELREAISRLYPGTDIEQILVTCGSSEANLILTWSHTEPGDEVILMLPNYMQLWGILRGFGATVKPMWLRESLNWAPDLEELKKLVTDKTKMIIVCNPNNPTGAILSAETMETIINLADRVGAWIHSDEVYRGAELDGKESPSFWGMYDKVVIVNGLSKAYGLPGLRIGWIVGPDKNHVHNIWRYHEYNTISASAISDPLARIALSPDNREKILHRTRSIIRRNLPILQSWLEKQDGIFRLIPPKAGAIAFPRYNLKINSTKLVNKLIHEKSVLVVPGDHFEIDHHLRFGIGGEKEYFLKALTRIEETIREVKGQES